jgi:hypothetical protein
MNFSSVENKNHLCSDGAQRQQQTPTYFWQASSPAAAPPKRRGKPQAEVGDTLDDGECLTAKHERFIGSHTPA